MSIIYSISIKFPPQTMMLKMMDFRKSQSQHPKPRLPSLTHHDFRTRQRWLSYPYDINSCPNPGKLLPIQPLKNNRSLTQHSWSSCPIYANSCPNPGRLLRQQVLILARQLSSSCAKHIIPKILPVNFLKIWRITYIPNIYNLKNLDVNMSIAL